jgi:urease accessory protein
VLGGGRAIGTLLIAPAEPLPPVSGEAAVMPLAGPGVLVSVVGEDIRQVCAVLEPLCAERTASPAPVAPVAARA